MIFSKISILEEDRERSDTVIFGLEEKGKERYYDALEVVKEILKETVRPGILVSNIDHIASLQEEEASILSILFL